MSLWTWTGAGANSLPWLRLQDKSRARLGVCARPSRQRGQPPIMAQVNDGTAGEPIKKLASDGKAAAAAAPPPSFARQLSFWPAIAILLPVMVALTWVSCYMHYTLPQPRAELYLPTSSSSSNGSSSPGLQAVFSEHEAMRYIHALATHEDGSPRYRIVGTEEMVLTEQYLLREIERIRDQVVEKMPLGLHQIEIWHQVRRVCRVRWAGGRARLESRALTLTLTLTATARQRGSGEHLFRRFRSLTGWRDVRAYTDGPPFFFFPLHVRAACRLPRQADLEEICRHYKHHRPTLRRHCGFESQRRTRQRSHRLDIAQPRSGRRLDWRRYHARGIEGHGNDGETIDK